MLKHWDTREEAFQLSHCSNSLRSGLIIIALLQFDLAPFGDEITTIFASSVTGSCCVVSCHLQMVEPGGSMDRWDLSPCICQAKNQQIPWGNHSCSLVSRCRREAEGQERVSGAFPAWNRAKDPSHPVLRVLGSP